MPITGNILHVNSLANQLFIIQLFTFFYRLLSGKDNSTPIKIKTHPFQQTSQPQEFNIGMASSALFIGMDLVLVPITLAVDMVYDREVIRK